MSDEVTEIISAVSTSLAANETPPPTETPASSPPPSEPGSGAPAVETPGAAPARESQSADAPAAPQPPSTEKPTSPSKAEAEAEEAELAAIEQEIVAKGKLTGKDIISASRHQAVLTRARRQHEAALAEAQKKYAAFEAPEFQDRIKAFQLAEHAPDRFVQLLQTIPVYRALFDSMVNERVRTVQPPPVPAPPVEETEPQPDTLLEGGGMGYSTERANELWAFRLKQAQKAFDEKFAKLEEGVKPIQEERQTRERIEQAFVRQGGILADARANWPLFSQYEPQIRAELAKPGHERMQLDQAYRNVVVNAERVERARIEAETRKKLTEEMNGHAAAPRTLRPGLPPPNMQPEGGDTEIESIIRNAARSLG